MPKPIRLLYYIPASTLSERMSLYSSGMYRGEMTYGAFHLKEHGISVVELSPLKDWHSKLSRLKYTIYLLLHSRMFDIIYSPYSSGLEYAI